MFKLPTTVDFDITLKSREACPCTDYPYLCILKCSHHRVFYLHSSLCKFSTSKALYQSR